MSLAGEPRQIVRRDRHRVRHRLSDRPGDFGISLPVRPRYPIFAAAFLSASSIVCTATLLPKVEPHTDEGESGPGGRRLGILEWKGYAEYFARPETGRAAVAVFLLRVLVRAFYFRIRALAQRRYTLNGNPFGAKEVGYIFAYVGFLGLILQGGLIGRLVNGWENGRWCGPASASARSVMDCWPGRIQLAGFWAHAR